MQRRVRHALETGDAGHVDYVGPSFALDQVDAIEVDAERSATAQRDVGLLGRRRERLAVFLRLRAGRKDLPDAEEPLADHVDLQVAPLGRASARSSASVWTTRTPNPQVPSNGLTTSGPRSNRGVKRSGCETTYVTGIGAPAAARIRAAITLSRSATVTGYGFTMAAPWSCRAPAMLTEMPEICFST